MKNKMEDLRNHLFAELERLGDAKELTKADLDKAKAISDVAGKLIDTARVEVEFHKVRAGRGDRAVNAPAVTSSFIESQPQLTAISARKPTDRAA